MSAFEMAKFPYQRLIHESDDFNERERVIGKPRGWFTLRRVRLRKRFKLKVPGLRRLILRKKFRVVFLRKKFRVVSAVRLSCAKVLKRLKESHAHFGDLFAGNYLFLQVNPTSIKCIKRSYQVDNEVNLYGLPSTYSLPRVSN